MIDGGSVDWSALLEPEQQEDVVVPVCGDGTSVALPVASAALAISVADEVGAVLQGWAVSYMTFILLSVYLISYFVQVGTSNIQVAGDLVRGPKALYAMKASSSLSSKWFDIYFFFNFQQEMVSFKISFFFWKEYEVPALILIRRELCFY